MGSAKNKNKKLTAGETPAQTARPVSIVGVGASAGGLEAFTQLLRHLPADTGLAFVLVQHLDPSHESELTRLLARATSMPTGEITDNLRVEPNRVYVIPPNVNLAIAAGRLKLEPRPTGRVPHRSVDFFFESLAGDQRERAIGVVLSGTASDGTLGLEAIKGEGGITFAQDGSAKHDSMPRSAVAAGCVDFVLSPEQIAGELARIARHPYFQDRPDEPARHDGDAAAPATEETAGHSAERERRSATAHQDDDTALPSGGRGRPATGAQRARADAERRAPRSEEDGFKKVLLLLRNHGGVDFSLYKSSTIQRRVARRAILNKRNTLDEYAAFLKGNTQELDALYSDVLIGVTSFFRNPEAFEALKRRVFPQLLTERTREDPVRVWTLGCSTGQEAYSIAMSFAEFSENLSRVPRLQIFATDLNDALLDKARQGLYARTLADDVSPERLRRFFVEEQGGYRVCKALREQIVFARQNLISDPPFSRLDLVTCRNLLIYLEPDLQKKLMPVFHYALKPGGFLFLGVNESIGPFTELFEAVDKKQKIFVKKAAATAAFRLPGGGDWIASAAGQRASVGPRAAADEGLRGELNAQREADRLSVQQFAPPGVLIDAELRVLQFRGATGAYLEPPAGKASFDLLKMARDGLMLPLRAAVNRARKEDQPVRKENVRFTGDGGPRTVTIQVTPLKNVKERCFLVLFEPCGHGQEASPNKARQGDRRSAAARKPLGKREESARIKGLERELAETREFLQLTREQSEAANEELQASNEEVQSANEELQSINEELETSKEELESTNEELITVNEEMSGRNAELGLLNGDLSNLQASIHTAIVLLSRELTIRRFTAPAEKAFNLLAGDVGRPIGGIRHNLLESEPLETLLREALETVSARQREVRDKDGRWYSLRVRPYLTLDNRVDGVVLMLVDIDELKRGELRAQAAFNYSNAVAATVRDPLVVLRGDLRVDTANQAFYRTFKVRPDETEGRLIYELGDGQWNIARLRELLEDILPRNSFFNDFEVTHDFPSLGRRTMLLNARRLVQVEGAPLVLLAIEDVTERLESRAAVRASEVRYRRLFEAAQDGILIIDPLSRKITDANPFMTRLLGYERDDLLGRELWQIGLLEDERASHAAFRELQRTGFIRYDDLPLKTKDGRAVEVEFISNLYQEDGHKVIQCNVRGITQRKRAEEALRRSEENYRLLVEGATGFAIIRLDLGGRVNMWNVGAQRILGYAEAEIVGELFSRFFIPEDQANERPARELAAARAGEKGEDENWLVRQDGSRFWASGATTALRDESGNLMGFAKIVRDMTERKQTEEDRREAEETLRQSEERFRMVADNISQLAWTCDRLGNVTWYNRRWLEYTGLSFEQMRGWNWSKVQHPDHVDRVVEGVKRAAESGEPWDDTFPLRSADGSYRWFLSRALPIRDPAGEIVCWFGTNTDVTEQRDAEEALKDADRRKNEFLAMLAHELRNPLAPIRNAAELLRLAGNNAEAVKSASEMMERQIGHVVRLVDDLLDVSRVSRGKIELRQQRIELASSVHHAVEAARPLYESTDHELSVALPREPIYLHADPIRLAQVVGNLLNNACKFTNPGGHVWLTVEREGGQVAIRVRDDGIGIAADQLPLIFELFTQLDASLERSMSGLGIGLTLVKSLVEMHGGTVEVHSAGLGQGSEFTVRLPVLEERPQTPAAEPTARPSSAATGRRILVVDDNLDSAMSLAMLLKLAGNETRTAHDGLEALEAAAAFKPDVVLLDIGLPKLNGYEVARKIRQQPWGKDMALVALTGWGQDEDRQKSQDAGFNAHLVKPVDYAALSKLLAEE